jgi:rRNA-processing protein FCF1
MKVRTTMSPHSNSQPQLVICDTNVIVLMVLFKPLVMFTNTYSFAQIEVDQSVIDEMQNWLDRNNKKVQKFTRPIIEQAINLSMTQSGRLKGLTIEEMERSHKLISAREAALKPEEKGMATSKTDKDLLSLAWKNKVKIATQERTMRSVGARTLGANRILSFEELVVDLIQERKITTQEVNDGLDAIARMNEKIDNHRGKLIKDALDQLIQTSPT